MGSHTCFLHECWEPELKSSWLTLQALSQLSHLPSPSGICKHYLELLGDPPLVTQRRLDPTAHILGVPRPCFCLFTHMTSPDTSLCPQSQDLEDIVPLSEHTAEVQTCSTKNKLVFSESFSLFPCGLCPAVQSHATVRLQSAR